MSIDATKITHFITQLNEDTKNKPEIIVPRQPNFWRFLNGSTLATKFTNTDIINQEKNIFFDLNKNKDILLKCEYYGVFINNITFDSSNGLKCDAQLHKIMPGNESLFSFFNISVNINNTKSIITVASLKGSSKNTVELYFSLEKKNGIDKIEMVLNNTEEDHSNIATFIFNNTLLKNIHKEEKIQKEHINDISNAIKNFFVCLNNYLSWLRLEQIEIIKKPEICMNLYPANQTINNTTAFQKYIKYKAKYIKLSNEINKHN
jgi:hypothetical protein